MSKKSFNKTIYTIYCLIKQCIIKVVFFCKADKLVLNVAMIVNKLGGKHGHKKVSCIDDKNIILGSILNMFAL